MVGIICAIRKTVPCGILFFSVQVCTATSDWGGQGLHVPLPHRWNPGVKEAPGLWLHGTECEELFRTLQVRRYDFVLLVCAATIMLWSWDQTTLSSTLHTSFARITLWCILHILQKTSSNDLMSLTVGATSCFRLMQKNQERASFLRMEACT